MNASSLQSIVGLLQSAQGLRMFKRAYRENMLYKIGRYTELLQRSQRDVEDALEVIRIKMPDLKSAANVPSNDTSDNWHIFESISGPYQSAKDQASRFKAILNRARERLTGSMEFDRVTSDDIAKDHRDALVEALEGLTAFTVQSHVVEHVVDVVSSFIKDPRLFRTRLMNFVLMGGAGTGKTTLAQAIGDVFARAGMFVGDNLILAGRGELVGQYMGETVTKTRNFLVGNLDNGVIFIDEAYGITPWEDGKPESYGTEATTAMVEFMTRYPGLYCIITAGYEREMVRYFLPSNEGLSRRFPHKFVLSSMTPDQLIRVFQRQLFRAQGYSIMHDDTTINSFFTEQAYDYLRRIITTSMEGEVIHCSERDAGTRKEYARVRHFRHRWGYMYRLFEHQAGSMANLADEAITVLYATLSFKEVITFHKRKRAKHSRPPIRRQGVPTMQQILLRRIQNVALSDSDEFVRQFREIEHIINADAETSC
jgi:hypothetical protein